MIKIYKFLYILKYFSHIFQHFKWNQSEKSLILSSFLWGYALVLFPCAYFISNLNVHKLFSLGVFLSGIFTVIIPVLAVNCGWVALIISRFCAGMAQACIFPCVETLLSRWVPLAERARASKLQKLNYNCYKIF